jgi:molybdopterin synthase sulfur carrier subunit
MRVTVLYFARLREALGLSQEVLDLPAGVDSLGQLRAWLVARGDPWRRAFAEVVPVRAALDQQVLPDETPLREGAEVAFFPPVTGG